MLLRDMALHLLFEFNLRLYGWCAMTTKLLIDRELLERVAKPVLFRSHEDAHADACAELRAILSAPRQPEGGGLTRYTISMVGGISAFVSADDGCMVLYEDAQRAIAELREEISDLHTTMMAAAVEIQEHWQAHCDEEGYGPANLMHRLERGIAAQYGYTAQTVVQIEAERDTLRQQLAERDATIARLEAGIPRIQEQSHQMRQQRDRLAGLLADVKADYTHAIHWEDMHATMKRIDAALAEVKP